MESSGIHSGGHEHHAGMASGETCALCGMVVGDHPVRRELSGRHFVFDSEDCARVYEAAAAAGVLGVVTGEQQVARARGRGAKTLRFGVEGMWCAACGVTASRFLLAQPGVLDADVSFAAKSGLVRYDPRVTNEAAIAEAVAKLGYRAVVEGVESREAGRLQESMLLRVVVAVGLGMQVEYLYVAQLYPAYALGRFDDPGVRALGLVAALVTLPVLLYGGWPFLRGALAEWQARTVGMDTLVGLAVVSAYTYSLYAALAGAGRTFFESVVTIVAFVMVGRYLESVAGGRARKSVTRLLSLQPRRAQVRRESGWETVDADTLAEGDEVLVPQGARVPADGVVSDAATVDLSALTGESAPRRLATGDVVPAGAVVLEGAPVVRLTHSAEDSRLAEVARAIQHALETKPRVQRLADRAAEVFTLGILLVAGLAFLGRVALGRPLGEAVLASVATLVVACPCALGLATPLAISAAVGRATEAGVIVRDPSSLESAGRVTLVAFDKTGTLSLDRPALAEVVPMPDVDRRDLLAEAAAVERGSSHPIARAITAAAEETPPASDFASKAAAGVSARIAGAEVRVGRASFVGGEPTPALAARAAALIEAGDTVVWVSRGGELHGFLVLGGEADARAAEAIRELGRLGVDTAILSGDVEAAVGGLAEALGVREWRAGQTPEEKAAWVAEHRRPDERVAFVGDGINDGPALAAADLAITVAGGTDVAGEASDLVLARDDLTVVPWLLAYARTVRRTVVQNLLWAAGYNAVTVPLAALGVIRPSLAAAGMAGSSLLVVLNSSRLSSARAGTNTATVPALES